GREGDRLPDRGLGPARRQRRRWRGRGLMPDLFDTLATAGASRCLLVQDVPSGLRAASVLDDLTLGPAAGGARTRPHPSIAAAVARALAAAGARLVVADLDPARARAVAADTGAEIVATDAILAADVDILAPCASGGVITAETARAVRAWAVCGAANNILADRA